MTQLYALDRNTTDNQKYLHSLVTAISMSQGQFKLILLRCNYINLRQQTLNELKEICSIQIRDISLNKSSKQLHSTIREQLGEEQPAALMVLGLELVIDIDELLISLNQVREELRKNFHFPLILWVNDEIVRKLIRLAPDLENWATIINFKLSDDELINIIQTITGDIFNQVLDAGAGKFLNISTALNLESGSSKRIELELAYREIKKQKLELEPELEASLEFVLGLAKDDSWKDSWKHYRRSLKLWHQNNNSIRYGCVLYFKGRWYRTFASRHPLLSKKTYDKACNKTKEYCEKAINIFRESKRLDLVANFINTLGEVLQRLKDWDRLEKIAEEARDLYPQHSQDKFRLARAYGFLAQVELHKENYSNTRKYAEEAIKKFNEAVSDDKKNNLYEERLLHEERLEWERFYHQGWYLLPLAQAQYQLKKVKDAIKNLELAKEKTKPEYDVKLYIEILEELRLMYKYEKKYLDAFKTKQEQQKIEQQYGLRFFVGVVRLQPEKNIKNPALQALPYEENKEKVAKDIETSPRYQDVKNLVERMGRHDCNLTIVYGASGVGKSSLLQAGLIPALRQGQIDNREVVLIIIEDNYNNWIEENICPEKNILENLEENAKKNRLTVIILDEFDDFLRNTNLENKKKLFRWLSTALDIRFVRIIISLRKDYLDRLLDIPRLINANESSILNHILDKNFLYYVGNFSLEQAKLSIARINNAIVADKIKLDFDKLVQNLADDNNEISPIKLQVIGAQLEAEFKKHKDDIGYIKKILESNSQEKLLNLYLAEVIQDCGDENKDVARLVLYLLIDEEGTRLIKTEAELQQDLEPSSYKQLNLILDILVSAGLIFQVSTSESKQYQLSHDYLVSLIRKKNHPEFLNPEVLRELNRTRQELREALQTKAMDEIKALNQLAELLWRSHDQLGALLASLKAAKKLKEITVTEENLKSQTSRILGHIVYRIQEYNRFAGHTHSVNSICFILGHDEQEMLVSASADHKIKLWSFEGKELKTLGEHSSEVNSISFNSKYKIIASAGADGAIKLWNLEGQERKTNKCHKTFINSVCFSPNGELLASASADKTIKLWDLDLKQQQQFRCLKSPHSRNPQDPNVRYKDYDYDETASHDSFVNCVCFSPKGLELASASADGCVKIWNVENGLEIAGKGYFVGKNVESNSVKFNIYGDKIIAANADRKLSLWLLDISQPKTLEGHRSHVKDASFSSDDRYIVSGSADGVLKLWSIDGKELQSVKAHNDEILSVCFSSDGQIVASASADNTIKLWKLENRELKTFPGHVELVNQVCFSPNGQIIASASEDGTVKLWDMNGKELTTLTGHKSFVNSVCFNHHGTKIASASTDRTIIIWNLQEGTKESWQAHETWVNSVCFSPDDTKIASGSANGEIKIWDLDGNKLFSFGHERTVKSICFSPDGTKIASASTDRTVKLWTAEGDLLQTFEDHTDWVRSVCFSHDGTKIASASNDRTIKLWAVEGQLLQTFKGHNSEVNSVFFGDDETIISTSADGTVKWWDLNGKELKTLPGYSECRSLCVSPDGEKIVLGNSDGTLTLFKSDLKFDLDDLLVRGCNWIRDYLKNNPNVSESDRHLCDGIGNEC